MKSLLGYKMANYFLTLSMSLKLNLSVYILTTCLDVLIGIMVCSYYLFNQPSCDQVREIVDSIFESKY